MLKEFIKEAWDLAKKKKESKLISEIWFKAALAYNKIHTYKSMVDSTWMCPMCHKIHKTIEFSPFTGLLYPACCGYPEGHRLYKEYATDTSVKPLDKPTEKYL